MSADLLIDPGRRYRVFRNEHGRLCLAVIVGSAPEIVITLQGDELVDVTPETKPHFDALAAKVLRSGHAYSTRQHLEHGFAREMTLEYSDMHGFWGGLTAKISGDRTFKVQAQGPGGPFRTHANFEVHLDELALDALASILYHGRVWDPEDSIDARYPGGIPPDTGFALIKIQLGNGVVGVDRKYLRDPRNPHSFVDTLKAWLEARAVEHRPASG